jgi:hypothetical protein
MAVRLELRPSWKHKCVLCDRVWHYPTSRQLDDGAFSVQVHMESAHNVPAPMHVQWERDHYAWFRKP